MPFLLLIVDTINRTMSLFFEGYQQISYDVKRTISAPGIANWVSKEHPRSEQGSYFEIGPLVMLFGLVRGAQRHGPVQFILQILRYRTSYSGA